MNSSDYGKVIFRDLKKFNRNTQSYPSTEYIHPTIANLVDADPEPTHVVGDIPFVPNVSAKKRQTYVHYGLEKAFTGESIGVVHLAEYIRIIKLLESSEKLKKNLSPTFLRKLFPEQSLSDMVSVIFLHQLVSVVSVLNNLP